MAYRAHRSHKTLLQIKLQFSSGETGLYPRCNLCGLHAMQPQFAKACVPRPEWIQEEAEAANKHIASIKAELARRAQELQAQAVATEKEVSDAPTAPA